MKKRQQRIERAHAIEREFLAAQFAGVKLERELDQNSGLLVKQKFEPADVRRWIKNLEGTYTIRVYAEFEATLREVWREFLHRDTTPPMRDLIDSIGRRRNVPDEVIDGVHKVREYRNGVVHEGVDVITIIIMPETQHYLCSFLSYMPLTW